MKKNLKYNTMLSGKKTLAVLLLAAGSLASCKKALDINTDPNSFVDVPITTILPATEVNLGYAMGGDATRIAGSIVQHYAGHRNQPLDYGQYNLAPTTTDTYWSNMYSIVLSNSKAIMAKGRAAGDSVYVGVAQILTAYSFGVLTDIYGDIPFSDALRSTDAVTPAYDKQENIYPALFTMLDQGIANVKSGKATSLGAEDLIFNGKVDKWEKFANSVKLRLYNHLSKVQPTAAADFLAKNPVLISTNDDNAAVPFGTAASNANPIYQFDVLSGRADNAVCKTLVDKMQSLSDPRIPVYFYPVKNNTSGFQGQFRGNDPGGDNDDSGESLFSRVGSAYASSNSPVVLLSAAEVQYIISEVQFRKGNTADSKTAFEKAISNDFDMLGLSAKTAAYLGNPLVSYNNTLQRIMEQKWLTMYQAPYESWTDWRRTGVPTLTTPVINRTNGVTPRRLSYPQLEINLNAQSLKNGPGIPVLYESLKVPVWWDKQ